MAAGQITCPGGKDVLHLGSQLFQAERFGQEVDVYADDASLRRASSA